MPARSRGWKERCRRFAKPADGRRVCGRRFEIGGRSGGVEEIEAKFGKIHILVNNAGITRDGLVLRMDDSAWQE